ncbi:MAG: glycosyltransferase family 2 protein [Archaeoglobaceae archaeon]
MRIATIVPVSPFENLKTLKESVEHVKSICNGKIVYVVDRNCKEDERGKIIREMGVDVLERDERRGKRAGAINDAVKYLSNFKPDFVLILDVDSRTDRETIDNCISALLRDKKAYIASTKRYISNSSNLVSETIEAEYRLINFLLSKSAFKQFNGLIGVLRFDFLLFNGLNEWAIAEDADFATRMHAKGYRAIIAKGKIYEQAPLSWKDLYSQRKRWYFGGLQLWRYRKEMRKAPRKVRLSWLCALTLTYFPILFLLFLPVSLFLILGYYKRLSKLKIVAGFIIYSFVLQVSAISAFLNFIRGKEVEWNAIRRA